MAREMMRRYEGRHRANRHSVRVADLQQQLRRPHFSGCRLEMWTKR